MIGWRTDSRAVVPVSQAKSCPAMFGSLNSMHIPKHSMNALFRFVVLTTISLCWMYAPVAAAEDAEVHREQVRAAREILDPWHSAEPKPAQRTVHVVCWTPSDRPLPDDYRARLTRIMQHIQDFYRKEMQRHGFGESTYALQLDDERQLVLHTVQGKHETSHYSGKSGNEIRQESLPTLQKAGIEPDRETVVLMCNLATWDAEKLRFRHNSPYYASGSFRSGTAWQLDSPELDARNLILREPMIHDGQYGRISLGKHNSIFIGGTAHELEHALGLPHCKERPDEAVRGNALMGSGNRTYGDELRGEGRGTFLTLAHAMRLASHPLFTGSVKGIDAKATAALEDLSITADDKAIHVSGIVKGSPPVYAVVAYFDPEGHGDYDATTATAVPTDDGRFTLTCDALKRGTPGEIRLFPLHVNGSAAQQMSRTTFRYPYRIADDGTPDLSMIKTEQGAGQ